MYIILKLTHFTEIVSQQILINVETKQPKPKPFINAL